MKTWLRGRRRWIVPVGALTAVLSVGGLTELASSASASAPKLDPITPAQLLAKARGAQLAPFSGTVEVTSNLGLPSVSSFGVSSSSPVLDLLTGTHDLQVWYGGPEQVRVAMPGTMVETDWIRNGADVWAWDSATLHVTHATLPPAEPGTGTHHATTGLSPSSLTPADEAQRLLDALDPTTAVSVRTPRFVAGHAAYELVLTPKSTTTTVGEVTLSIDAATGVPLDVQVTAKGAGSPTFEVGFTKLDDHAPDPAKFAFVAPPGASVTQASDPTALASPALSRLERHAGRRRAGGTVAAPVAPVGSTPRPTVVGTGWDTVAIVSAGQLPAQLAGMVRSAPAFSAHGVDGHLVTTALVDVLFLTDGRVAVGAVTPDALAAAVAQAGP